MRRGTALIAAVACAALLLSGCEGQSHVEEGSSVTVATSEPFRSLNDRSNWGNTAGNRAVVEAVNSSFAHYDDEANLVFDETFGTASVLGNDPLTVRYRIADGVRWSDGVEVDAADLLLAWAASGALNSPDADADADASGLIDRETGEYTSPPPAGMVYFDAAVTEGLALVTRTPEVSDDGRALTLVFDHYFVDWPLVFNVGLPAHVVATHSLELEEGEQPKAALIAAVKQNDRAALSRISQFWNTGFSAARLAEDATLRVTNGPYSITEVREGEQLTLKANPHYRGARQPTYESVVVKVVEDPLEQVSLLAAGRIDVIAPALTPDVDAALEGTDGVGLVPGMRGSFAHLDLMFQAGRSGAFSDPRVREAFLLTVPRTQIIADVPGALQRDSFALLPDSAGYAGAVTRNTSSRFADVDIEHARSLLDAAAVDAPAVCILFDARDSRRSHEYVLIRDSAALAGFQVSDCSSPDWVGLLGTPGTHDAALFAWEHRNQSVTALAAQVGTDARINFNGYSSVIVDGLLDELAVTPDPEAQLRLRLAIDRELWEDSYGMPLYQYPVVVAHQLEVTGISVAPFASGILGNAWAWAPRETEGSVQ